MVCLQSELPQQDTASSKGRLGLGASNFDYGNLLCLPLANKLCDAESPLVRLQANYFDAVPGRGALR
jgi:hypothetical protein